jgi:lysophospholipase L1-like esterase
MDTLIKGIPDWNQMINDNFTNLDTRVTENHDKLGVLNESLLDIVREQTTQNNNISLKANQADLDTTNTKVLANTNAISLKANQADLDTKFGSMGSTKTFKGSCTYANLPTSGMKVDDYWYVTDKTTNYCYNGTSWVDIGNNLNIGDSSVTTSKRTPLGEYGWVTSQYPININTNDKTLEFPNSTTIYLTYRNKNINIGSTVKNTKLALTFTYGGGFVVFNTTSNTIIALDALPTDGENYIILGYVYFSPSVVVKLNMNYTVNGLTSLVDGSATSSKRTVLGDYGCIASPMPININTITKKLEFPNSDYIHLAYRNVNNNIASTVKNTSLDISSIAGGGFISYNTSTKLIEVGTLTENSILLGYVYLYLGNIFLNANYTIDGRHSYHKFYGKNLVCLGDSTTWGDNSLGTGGPSISWTSKMHGLCGFNTVINSGVCGSKIAKTSGRTDSFIERYASLDTSGDVILVMGGVNDFLFNVPLGTFNDTINTTFYGALKILISGLIDMYPSKKIIFMTPCKVNHATYGQTFTANSLGFKQIDYVNAIKEVCDYFSIKVFDMYASSGISPYNSTQATAYMPDKLHYNEDGYTKLANTIAGFLETI